MWFIRETLSQLMWGIVVFASVVGGIYAYTHTFAKCSDILRMCILGW